MILGFTLFKFTVLLSVMLMSVLTLLLISWSMKIDQETWNN